MSLVSTTSGKIVFVHLHTVKLHPGALHESKSTIPQSSLAHRGILGSLRFKYRFTLASDWKLPQWSNHVPFGHKLGKNL